ncbi:MAG: DMT family transporter [Rhodoferax sp.]|uniref:DMT family transporter n=1 Tax=Rhodoferax sp. TaxID=50421 RepID=UPI0017B7CBDB|nr:DMT family transporter [Rhodoferax sp.]NMM13294.1 DMT family transporter [Rhodoferax sp.]NMM20822.1 DMT family transporter [Rhodoferax sp.]
MQALWMVLGAFFFATMTVGIKVASGSFSTFELVFYRGVVSVIFMGLVLRTRGTSLKTTIPMMHAWRSVIGVLSLSTWFYAIAHLPLATAMTLNYMSGVWVAAFIVGGAVLYGQAQRQGPLMVTVLTSFAGVVLMLRPTLDQHQLFAGLVGLLSGMGAALAYLQVTALGKAGEPEGRTVFYFSVGTAAVGLTGIAFTGLTPWSAASWQATAWLVPIGVLASLGQWCMTRAYSRGSTLLVANLQYSGIVFAAIYSLLLFGDQIALLGWAGMGLIVASGLAATVLRSRAIPNTPAEEH